MQNLFILLLKICNFLCCCPIKSTSILSNPPNTNLCRDHRIGIRYKTDKNRIELRCYQLPRSTSPINFTYHHFYNSHYASFTSIIMLNSQYLPLKSLKLKKQYIFTDDRKMYCLNVCRVTLFIANSMDLVSLFLCQESICKYPL